MLLTIFFTHTILLSTMVQTFFFSGGGAGGCSFSTAGSNFSRTCVTVDNFVILPLSVLIKLLSTTSSSNFLRLMDLEEVLRGSWAEFWLWGGRSWLMRCFGVPSVTDPDWLCTEGRDSRDVDWSSSVIVQRLYHFNTWNHTNYKILFINCFYINIRTEITHA